MNSCPHCGKPLEIVKAEDLTASKTVARPTGDLASGIMKATTESIEQKMAKTVETTIDENTNKVLSSLEKLNQFASGNLSKDKESGFGAGVRGTMIHAMRKREEMMSKGYDPKTIKDPETASKAAAASKLQNLIHGFLNKGSDK